MYRIKEEVLGRHASTNTKYHVLYGFYFLGLSKSQLAKMYGKHHTTISSWIKRYRESGLVARKERRKVSLQFGAEKRRWLIEQFKKNPTLFLDEARDSFEKTFNCSISTSSVSRILHEQGYTWKVLERRAIQVQESQICHFVNELAAINWDLHHLIFLDEVSIDNRGMLRNRGYAKVGEKLIYRGEFNRKARVSLLCFLGQTGMKNTYLTEGTFTRAKFFECCRSFANSGEVYRHPGVNSVWILDGARIHCHRRIVEYLRSLGIHVIFLPPYTPFFNPIEYIFGYCKKKLQRVYVENSSSDLTTTISATLNTFTNFNCTRVFRKCGYLPGGKFNPANGLSQNIESLGFENVRNKD